MNAEPLLGVYAGYSLKREYVKPGPDLEPYVQEALEEIEYITGPATSKWGALRHRRQTCGGDRRRRLDDAASYFSFRSRSK